MTRPGLIEGVWMALMGKSVVAAMLAGAFVPQAAGQAADGGKTFCQRLAEPLKMRLSDDPDDGALPGHPAYWLNQTTLGMALVGGARSTSIGVEAVGDVSLAEYKVAQQQCEATKKGAACHIVGPVKLHIGIKVATAEIEAAAGERAEVWVTGLHIYCRDA